MWMLLGILVVGALGGVCMAALRNVSGDVGGGMGRDYMAVSYTHLTLPTILRV